MSAYLVSYLVAGIVFGFLIAFLSAGMEEPEMTNRDRHINMIMSIFLWPVGMIYIIKGMYSGLNE